MGRRIARKIGRPVSGDLVRKPAATRAAPDHPVSRLQRTIGNAGVTRLMRAPAPAPVRERDWAQQLEDCMHQTDDLLPGGVGGVEHIHREVLLNDILGRDRPKFEAEVRKDWHARQFVCEAGLGAVMALFYNKDYNSRLFVKRARESFAAHPEWYTLAAFDKARRTKAFLEVVYGISIQNGDKPWSTEDLALLREALGTLRDSEIPLIRGYRFLRWSTKCNQMIAKDKSYECVMEDYATCGLHLPEIIHGEYTITMYDCYKPDPAASAKTGFKVRPGAEAIVHEIGHAMEIGRLRIALEKQRTAKREVARLQQQVDAAKGSAKTPLMTRLAAAKAALDAADKDVAAALSAGVLDQFEKLTKGKRPLTPYSARSSMEAFAEAFMLFKLDPERLKKANKPLFEWFERGGFL